MRLRRGREILLTAGLLALLVGAGLVTTFWLRLHQSVPELSGAVTAPGLDDVVIVRIDSFAIPHIDAADDHDALFAEGWMHGSERLWQMELLRRVAQGRLAELFGSVALPTDRLMRTLGVWRAAGQAVASMDSSARADLQAYVDGVNARIASWSRPLPPEFELLGIRPEPWSAQAAAAIGKLMTLDLSSWQEELSRWHASRVLPAAKFDSIRPRWPRWAPSILEPSVPPGVLARAAALRLRSATPGVGTSATLAKSPVRLASARLADVQESRERSRDGGRGPDLSRLDPLGLVAGISLTASNAWVLGGERTATGHPLLANDTHLGLRAPSIWYIVGLRSRAGPLDAAGFSIPGVPGVVIGLNRGVAWGFTNGMVDDMDFAVEAVNLDGSAYRTATGWRDFAVRPETLQVRGQAPEVLRVRRTVRGPVLSDVLPGVNETLSAVWAGAHTTGGLAALLAMDRTPDPVAFDTAVRRFDGPAQNVLWASADGHIGYRLAGAVPRRPGWNGTEPVSSQEMGSGWDGLEPPDSLPAALFGPGEAVARPPGDFLASANNLQAPNLFGVFGVDYDPFRARRIVDRLSEAHGWGVEDMEGLQRDVHSLLADMLLGQAVSAARSLHADSAAELLAGWNRRADTASRGAGLFYTWLYRLRSLVGADEYGGGGRWAYLPMTAFLDIVLHDPSSPWVDDVRTDTVETLVGLERRAMSDAIRASRLRRWADLNRERSGHPLGRVPWMNRLFRFDVGPAPVPGGPHTVRVAAPGAWARLDTTSWRPPHVGGFGPSERFVASLEPGGPRGWVLLPTGEDGNPMDRHYRDMAARWDSTGTLVPLPMEVDSIRAITVTRVRLVPPADVRRASRRGR